jgi:CBS domain-containing protein
MSEILQPSAVGSMPVSSFVADAVAGIAEDATLLEVADALVAEDVGALVVRQEGRVIGIVSERDVVHALAQRMSTATTRAIDVATRTLTWCDCDASVAEVATEMAEQYVRHVLVEDEGEVVGIVSVRDLLGAYAAADTSIE